MLVDIAHRTSHRHHPFASGVSARLLRSLSFSPFHCLSLAASGSRIRCTCRLLPSLPAFLELSKWRDFEALRVADY
jgi:hypothetical protein